MTATKAQEREALKKIEEIVKGLGEDSYLSITFNGCFEQAKENIENDWGNNYLDMYNLANEDLCNIRHELEMTKENYSFTKENLFQANENISVLNKAIAGQRELAEDIANAKRDACNELDKAKYEIEVLKGTITELKAKLYDLMTK